MPRVPASGLPRYRVWLTGYNRWRPAAWHDLPPTAVALEPAEQGAMTAEQAAAYIAAFNRRMMKREKHVWAVPVRVEVQYAGDLQRGQVVSAEQLEGLLPTRHQAG